MDESRGAEADQRGNFAQRFANEIPSSWNTSFNRPLCRCAWFGKAAPRLKPREELGHPCKVSPKKGRAGSDGLQTDTWPPVKELPPFFCYDDLGFGYLNKSA
jgi:hypothetical protein